MTWRSFDLVPHAHGAEGVVDEVAAEKDFSVGLAVGREGAQGLFATSSCLLIRRGYGAARAGLGDASGRTPIRLPANRGRCPPTGAPQRPTWPSSRPPARRPLETREGTRDAPQLMRPRLFRWNVPGRLSCSGLPGPRRRWGRCGSLRRYVLSFPLLPAAGNAGSGSVLWEPRSGRRP